MGDNDTQLSFFVSKTVFPENNNYSLAEIPTYNSSSVQTNSTDNVANEKVQDLIYLSLYSLTCVTALLGNFIVCKVVFTKPSMMNFTNLLLANMAISDMFCALMFPFGLLVCWDSFILNTGTITCVTAKVIQLLSFQVSSVTMTFIALDRFMLVYHPLLRKHRVVPIYVVIATVWIVSFVIIAATSPSLAFHRYFTPSEPYIKCQSEAVFGSKMVSTIEQRVRVIVANLVHFWIPLVVIFVCYGSITWKVLKRKVGNLTATQQDALLHAKWKTIKMLIAAVAVFLLCWLPFFILNLIDFVSNPQRKRPCNKSGAFFIAVWIAFTSCCCNPFVYWIYSEEFREGLKGLKTGITAPQWLRTIFFCKLNRKQANILSRQRTRTISSGISNNGLSTSSSNL